MNCGPVRDLKERNIKIIKMMMIINNIQINKTTTVSCEVPVDSIEFKVVDMD